jgi:MBG domain-containing protein/putative Ig domain-containing protein
MTKRILHTIILSAVALCAGVTHAAAASYRGGTLSWVPTGTAFEVELRLKIAQRLDDQHLGDAFTAPVSFGDTQTGTATGTVTSVNTAEEWFIAELTVRHTYASAGPFTAYVDVCCRSVSLANGAGGSLHLATLVRPDSGNSSPVTGLPAIVAVPLTTSAAFTVPAADIDHDTLKFRLATAAESGITSQPAGLTINQTTGIVTWNPVAAGAHVGANNLWATQVIVEDVDTLGAVKSSTPVDVVLKIIAAAGTAPVLNIDPASPFHVAPGDAVTFDVIATDADAASLVTLNASSLPDGSTLTPAFDAVLPAPAASTFNWTPTAAQIGAHVITFAATDDSFQQTLKPVTIVVAVNAAPVLQACAAPITVAATSASGALVTLDNTVSDANGDALTITWKIGSTVALTQNLAAGSTGPTAISFGHTYAVGTYSVLLTATDGGGASASCTTSVTVTPAGTTAQTITFGALAPVTYGVAPVTLTATATSGLPVTFSKVGSGPATIVNGLLTVTGAGTVTIRASQAGNGTYAAAASVDRTLVVNKAALTVKANDASKTYGAPLPTFGVTYTGLVGTDTSVSLGGTLAFTTPVTTTTAPGVHSVTPGGLTSDNYTITFAPGVLTVTKAPLTVTASSATISVDATLPVFTAQMTGFVLGQTAGVLGGTLTFTTPSGANAVAGTYAVTPSGLTSDNYSFTYVAGVLTVTAGVCEFQATEDANAGRTIVIKVSLCSPTGRDLSSDSVTLTAFEVTGPSGTTTPQSAGNSNPGGVFRKTGKTYSYNLKTTGLPAGAYQLKFRVSGDSIPQTVRFSIR